MFLPECGVHISNKSHPNLFEKKPPTSDLDYLPLPHLLLEDQQFQQHLCLPYSLVDHVDLVLQVPLLDHHALQNLWVP